MILVSGGARARPAEIALAESVGRLLARSGAVVLTGGGTGVMEAASRGARAEGGTTLAVLQGASAQESPPNRHVTHAIYTGMGNARNAILVRTADATIAIGGSWGTLSEIALARNIGRPVVLLMSWGVEPPDRGASPPPPIASSAEEAVRLALELASDGPPSPSR